MEAGVGFVLGAIAGCALGAIEGPINQVMARLTSGSHLKVMMDAVGDVGPLGVGTLLGATALFTAVASAVTGVTTAALLALLLLRARRLADGRGSPGFGALLWMASGVAAVLGMTGSGATLGVVIETLAQASGASGLMCGLLVLALGAPLLRLVLLRLGDWERLLCGLPDPSEEAQERERREQEEAAEEQRQLVAVEMEQRITMLEEEEVHGGGESNGDGGLFQNRAAWEVQWRERKEAEREEQELLELEEEQRSISQHVATALSMYSDLLAFSGIPMTVTAAVTVGLGLAGFGDYRFVFLILLALVLIATFALMRSARLRFWKFAAAMALFATFAVAVLTVHAGQEVASATKRLRAAGKPPARETALATMRNRSSLEAVAAGFFVAKLCQVGLGATAGGPLGRQVHGKVVLGAAGTVAAILGLVRASAAVLGAGGSAGALLGAAGAAGVSLGSAAAIAVGSSTWVGTLATTMGMVTGALTTGKWDVPNLIQVPVAYMFAMTKPY